MWVRWVWKMEQSKRKKEHQHLKSLVKDRKLLRPEKLPCGEWEESQESGGQGHIVCSSEVSWDAG